MTTLRTFCSWTNLR